MYGRILIALAVSLWLIAPGPSGLFAGEPFRDCDDCPEMVVVPAGTFMMGTTQAQGQLSIDKSLVQYPPVLEFEKPQHQVVLSEPFALGRYEVTFDEWDVCVADGGCDNFRPDGAGWGRGPRPVINVSWKDAQAYVAWLSEKTGEQYRLPAEAEWEYAARSGTTTMFAWGDDITAKDARYGLNDDGTSEVGAYPPNAWGLHDMHGNVSEWVEDCKNETYEGAPSDGTAWTGGDCMFGRGLRGGSWENYPGVLRSASRGWEYPGARVASIGFRVARSLP